MVLVPIVVKNQDELEKASKLKRDVIIVKNQELFEAIQKQKKKLNRKKVGNNLGIIGGIIMGVSSFVCPASIGLYLFAGSIVGVSAGTWGKLTSLMQKGLKNYSGTVLLVGINYNKSDKHHECLIETIQI